MATSSPPPRDEKSESMGEWLMNLIIVPGTHPKIITTINYSLGALLLVGVWCAFLGFADIHVYVLMFLATGLMASVNWFMSELRKIEGQSQSLSGNIGSAEGAEKKHD